MLAHSCLTDTGTRRNLPFLRPPCMSNDVVDESRTVNRGDLRSFVRRWRAERRAAGTRRVSMWMTLIQTAFYLSVGLALFGAVVWYVGVLRTAIAGGGDLVIVPFTIATGGDDKDGRGAA